MLFILIIWVFFGNPLNFILEASASFALPLSQLFIYIKFNKRQK